MWRSPLRSDFPALLALRVCRRSCQTRRCVRCAQTGCGKSDVEARCARPPQDCAARRPMLRPHRAPPAAKSPSLRATGRVRTPWLHATGRARTELCEGGLGLAAARTRVRARTKNSPEDCSSPGESHSACKRCGAEESRTCGPARSADQHLTHRVCLSAANVASDAMGPQDRAPQGSLSAAKADEHKRRSQSQPAFAGTHLRATANGQRTSTTGR